MQKFKTRAVVRETVLGSASAAVGALALFSSSGALAQASAESQAESGAGSMLEEVVISGRRISQTDKAIGMGAASNTVGVTREELLSAPAGISGLKMLESLPGFNVQTDGALGLYEFGNSVQVRAFDLSQIGFVLDGVPMGRSDAFGGSPIFRYVDNENLQSVVASPGAGDVSLPSYATLGPMVSYTTTEPDQDPGVRVSLTQGQFNLERTYLRVDTGDIGGFSAYLARSKTDSDLWRGPGSIDREHYEGKAVYQFSDDTSLQFTYVSNDFFDYDSPSGTKSTFDANYDFSYLASVPDSCINPQPEVFDFNGDGAVDRSDFTPVFTDGSCTRYFEDRVNVREDALYSLSLRSRLNDRAEVYATGYYEDKDGFGVSPDSYGNSLGIYTRQAAAGLDVTHPRGVQYGLSEVGGDRAGVVAGVEWQIGIHTLSIGGWYEDETYNRTQIRLNKTAGSSDGDIIQDEVAYFRRNYTSTRETLQLHVKDSMRLMQDRLSLELGFKSLTVDYALSGFRDFADYELNSEPGYGPQAIDTEYSDNFQPMVGGVYDLNDSEQLFASYSRNFALPQGADTIFSVATSFVAPAPDAEEAENYELGVRTNRQNFNGALSVFYTAFDNRLLRGNVLNPATNEPEGFFVNAGATEAIGFELSGVYQPDFFNNNLYFNTNVSYSESTLKDGFGSNPAGSTIADSPDWLFTGGLTFEPTDWVVSNLSFKYTGKRYADFAEQVEMEDYTVWSAYVDLNGGAFGYDNISLRFNLDNITDEQVLSFVFAGSPFFRPLSPRTFQATLTAAF